MTTPYKTPDPRVESEAKSAPAFSFASACFLFSVVAALGFLLLAPLQFAFQNFPGSALSMVFLVFFGGIAVAAKSPQRRRKTLCSVVAPAGLILALYFGLTALRMMMPNVIVEPRQTLDGNTRATLQVGHAVTKGS